MQPAAREQHAADGLAGIEHRGIERDGSANKPMMPSPCGGNRRMWFFLARNCSISAPVIELTRVGAPAAQLH
jgi:hypothetical protein